MARIGYIEDPPKGLEEAYDANKKMFGRVSNITKLMAHKPEILLAFQELGKAISNDNSIDAKLKEKIILRVSKINGCHYCLSAHTFAAKKAGLTEEEIGACLIDDISGEAMPGKERVAIRYASEVTKNVACSDETFDELKRYFSEKQIVYITSLIAFYNYLTRFNDALNIDIDF